MCIYFFSSTDAKSRTFKLIYPLSNPCSTFSLDVSQSTISSANSVDSGGVYPSSLGNTSMIIMKRMELSAET